jgi:uncharacterized protein YndB with AHSA1/START domain
MNKPVIKSVLYIASSRAKVCDALTNPQITQKYWSDTRLESDWKAGSKLIFRRKGEITDENTVLDVESERLLRYTFEPKYEEFLNEPPSRVTFSISDNGEVVRLIMLHDEFEPDSKVYPACIEGWPMILNNLKTLLETGKPLSNLEFSQE